VAVRVFVLILIRISHFQAMYPSIQAKIWGNMGKVTELVDTVLDSFIKASTTGGLGSVKAEVMADTSVALATANVQVVSSKFINRLLMVRFELHAVMGLMTCDV
jgi:neurofibromin 1